MKVLILEDNNERRAILNHTFIRRGGIHAIWSLDCKDCIDKIKMFDVDVLFLDHDLTSSPYKYDGEYENSGSGVIKWMIDSKETNPVKRIKSIIVHTGNHFRRPIMKMMLENAGFENVKVISFYDMFNFKDGVL